MAPIEIQGVPEEVTVMQGYFVWSGLDEDGHRVSGGVEYPFNLEDDPENQDYDGHKVIGMLTVARSLLIENEMAGQVRGDEDED